MSDTSEIQEEEITLPVFEYDQQDRYAQYMIKNRREIGFHLKAMINHRTFLTLYINDGDVFYLTNLIEVDEEENRLVFDAPLNPDLLEKTLKARQITVSAILDRVKIQLRLQTINFDKKASPPTLVGTFPDQMLRLQRREFFRIETPKLNPLRCKLARRLENGRIDTFDLPLFDMSGGGLCLLGEGQLADRFSQGELLSDCRLEIPGENVFKVNLCVREVMRQEHARGTQVRLGCEFVDLSGATLSHLERYITRLERERKARESGLN